ncbi:uncharacterized protein LOC114355705 [Ostrinia furnacalis]|uniref:uncharacterized protein LOC114355705 n=1 Tax=Ostrinia furnacalis TaxID=93504 RepID=UPI001038D488|nr:uncharacterized protein LOC114355705 [Ostrinia furnacalis]
MATQVCGDTNKHKTKLLQGQCKAAITRCVTFLDKKSDPSVFELTNRRKAVEEAFARYNRLADEAILQGQEVLDGEEEFEERYYEALSRIDALLDRCSSASPLGFASAVDVSTPLFETTRLPPIEIQSFDGNNVCAYKPFIELFMELIGKNFKLSNVQKLYYLKGYLKGEALNLVNNLPLINQSYHDAIALLNRRYDTKGLMIKTHISTILDLPSITRGTAQAIRSLVSQISQQMSALRSYDEPVDSWDSILVCIVMKKLDSLTVRLFSAEQDFCSMPSMESLLSFLERRAISLEASSACDTSRTERASMSFHISTCNTKPNPKCNNAKSTMIPCLLCRDSCHKLYKCPTFLSMKLSERLSHVNNYNLYDSQEYSSPEDV